MSYGMGALLLEDLSESPKKLGFPQDRDDR